MSFIYEKKDPDARGKSRWMAKVKVSDIPVVVSLRLVAPANKRIAKQRAIDLQREIDAGVIGDATREWLSGKTADKLSGMIHKVSSNQADASPNTWQAACDGYLLACLSRDTKEPIPGSAVTINRTLAFRSRTINAIARWMIANEIAFDRRSFTSALIQYIQYRITQGIKSSTLWGGDYGWGVHWGEWLHSKGLCEKPNREAIVEAMPRKPVPITILPPLEADVAAIKMFRDHREDPCYSRTYADDLESGVKIGRYWSSWSLVLCVRGLGCRPTEAAALTWKTVDLDKGVVVIVDTKTRTPRKIPILFRWVLEGLTELREKFPEHSPVCCSTQGLPWTCDSGACDVLKRVSTDHLGYSYHLKKAQKLYIAQLISAGFPPHVVAKWTGHTLTIQDKHYCEDNSYLPSDHDADYGEFGVLSDWGKRVKEHLTSFVRELI